jgi:choline dehydrogenase-like flavoprotein
MLLASRGASPGGVANRSDLVGRCFMEHPHLIGQGAVVFGAGHDVHPAYRDNVVDRGVAVGKTRVVAGTTMTPQARRDAGTLGCIVTWFAPLGPWEKSTEAQLRGVRTMLGGRKGIESTTFLNLGIRAEQHPKRDSRVLLTDKRDALGMPVAALDWKLADDEVASMHTTVDRLAREIGRRGLGRIRLPKENFADYGYQLTGGFHHMGTVRMHADPASGVLDENLRAHDVENLYVASSAAFTTSGVSNPTLTIVALTLRLADHLAKVAKARG